MNSINTPALKSPQSEAVAQLSSWEGRSQSAGDFLGSAPLHGLSAVLDRPPMHSYGDQTFPRREETLELPALWHWLYFLPRARQDELGSDGHPRQGGFMPPIPLPRRMWAGGRLAWQRDNSLKTGQQVERTTIIQSVAHKSGRSGELVFLCLRHELRNSSGLAVSEEQDIVYRAAARPGDPVPPPVTSDSGAAWQRELVADEAFLFRYSALTFNAHRIHYDRSYATAVEGYPGLVLHGPLIATLLADLVRRHAPDSRMLAFDFRAQRPIFDNRPFRLNGQPSSDGKAVKLWASDEDGIVCMSANATLA